MSAKDKKCDSDGFVIDEVAIEDGVVVIHSGDVLITVNKIESGIEVCRCDTRGVPLTIGGVVLERGGRIIHTVPRRVR